jgi:hypothetical protein
MLTNFFLNASQAPELIPRRCLEYFLHPCAKVSALSNASSAIAFALAFWASPAVPPLAYWRRPERFSSSFGTRFAR